LRLLVGEGHPWKFAPQITGLLLRDPKSWLVKQKPKVVSSWCQSVKLIFGRPFVKWFGISYRTVVCTVLSVTLVCCGQTVVWIRMPVGVEVGLGPGHIVLDVPAPPPERGTVAIMNFSTDSLEHIGCCTSVIFLQTEIPVTTGRSNLKGKENYSNMAPFVKHCWNWFCVILYIFKIQ